MERRARKRIRRVFAAEPNPKESAHALRSGDSRPRREASYFSSRERAKLFKSTKNCARRPPESRRVATRPGGKDRMKSISSLTLMLIPVLTIYPGKAQTRAQPVAKAESPKSADQDKNMQAYVSLLRADL